MWLALKSEDPRKAKKGLIVAVIVYVVALAIFLAIAGFIASLAPTIFPPTIMPPSQFFLSCLFLSFIILAACYTTSN